MLDIERFFNPPHMARPSIAAGIGVFARFVFEPEARFLRPASWGARRCRREAQGGIRAIRGRAFFGYFLCTIKESNLPWVSHPQVCVAAGDTKPIRVAQKTRGPFKTWIPAFARMTVVLQVSDYPPNYL